ncbi:hypothetical protein [uncultured Acinetobacter sp.]|uniref:hypothetical protein n=1 Tax=uncultured Acinetobacter sp. TaxID=165433 RepID=UPI0025864412|nr:hypothetical protein [uncultured Acinetobacter sp.]
MSEASEKTIYLRRAKVNGEQYIFTELEEFSPGFYPKQYHSTDGGEFFQYIFESKENNSLLFIYCNKVLDSEGQRDLLEKWEAEQS